MFFRAPHLQDIQAVSDSRPQIIIGPQPRTLRRTAALAWALLAAIGIGAIGTSLLLGRDGDQQGRFGNGEARAMANAEILRLEQRISILERGTQVTELANQELREQLVEMQGQMTRLTDEVGFYQRLIGAGGGNRGLAVHDLQLERTSSSRVYRFVLTLSQNLKKADQVAGRLELAVEGVRADQAAALDSAKLGVRMDGESSEFAFKYFQQIGGSFELPADFHPHRVIVSLHPDGEGPEVAQSFDWADLIKESKDV